MIIDRNVDAVNRAFAELELSAPAYAACLWLSLDDLEAEFELSCDAVSIGLEPDRERARGVGSEWDWFSATWNAACFALQYEPVEGVRTPEYQAAEAEVVPVLREHEEMYGFKSMSDLWLMNQVARRLTERPSLMTVTDDFLVFLDDESTAQTACWPWGGCDPRSR